MFTVVCSFVSSHQTLMSACSHRPSVNRAVLIQSVASRVAVILALNFKVMEFPAMVSCVQGRVISSFKDLCR